MVAEAAVGKYSLMIKKIQSQFGSWNIALRKMILVTFRT
jgi:hypothetical protein